ncbi:MAG: hypothetical protein NXI32_19360 [bacterium]|nr:hypothetical protein [bacterium]
MIDHPRMDFSWFLRLQVSSVLLGARRERERRKSLRCSWTRSGIYLDACASNSHLPFDADGVGDDVLVGSIGEHYLQSITGDGELP